MQFAGNLLSKEQMKVVKGGTDTYGGIYSGDSSGSGSCGAKCYWPGGGGDSQWNLSMEKAKNAALDCALSGGRGYWCCASC